MIVKSTRQRQEIKEKEKKRVGREQKIKNVINYVKKIYPC